MKAEDILRELDALLTAEQEAIRTLAANLAAAHAEKKLELFGALAEVARGRTDLKDEVAAISRRARQNAMLLAFARDCVRDAMGTVAHHLNARPDPTRAPASALRKGMRVSVTG